MSSLKKKCNVVMLPTDIEALLGDNCYLPIGKKLIINNLVSHLYITSDDEIKEGDWFIKMNHKGGKPTLYQESKKAFMNSEWLNSSDVNDCFKIITTTDKSLGLPEPSPQFIQKYISEWNKGNIITEVMVEFETKTLVKPYDVYNETVTFLKVDSNNCITITKVKDSYSKEEVKQLLIDCCGEVSASDGKLLGKTPVELYKWIKNNL